MELLEILWSTIKLVAFGLYLSSVMSFFFFLDEPDGQPLTLSELALWLLLCAIWPVALVTMWIVDR